MQQGCRRSNSLLGNSSRHRVNERAGVMKKEREGLGSELGRDSKIVYLVCRPPRGCQKAVKSSGVGRRTDGGVAFSNIAKDIRKCVANCPASRVGSAGVLCFATSHLPQARKSASLR